jgi:hypothetical protein
MRGALKEELTNRLPWLFDELSFQIREHDYSYKHMGSSYAVVESPSMRVKFVNDRGSISVEVAPSAEPERWMELGFLWFSLTGNRPSPELEGWGWFLRTHEVEIAKALGPQLESTKAAFEQSVKESQEIGKRLTDSWKPSLLDRMNRFSAGGLGWLIAVALLIRAIVNE